MVENTNSITLEVQGSVGLTYMVGFIPLNLRSQERDKGVPHTRTRRRRRRPSRAWRGEAGKAGRQASERAGVAWFSCLSLRQPSDPVSSSASRVTLLLQLTDSWRDSASAGRLMA
jgi:hypothetical protein